MARSHYILRDETAEPRPPVYMTAFPVRRRGRGGLGPIAVLMGLLLLALLALAM